MPSNTLESRTPRGPSKLALPALAALLCVLASPAAAEFTPGEVDSRYLYWDGIPRTFDVKVPASYSGDEPLPLLIDIHGYSSANWQQTGMSGFYWVAEEENFIVAWPQGTGPAGAASWNSGQCCGTAVTSNVDDVGFVRDTIRRIGEEANVDPTRIYVTGLSNGGAMSHLLACEAADVFAATAPMAFPVPVDPMEACLPSRPISVAMVMGLSDVLVPYNPSWVPGAVESFEFWRSTNGCSGEAPQWVAPLAPSDFGNARCETYTACDGGVETRLCSIEGQADPFGIAWVSGHLLYFNNSGYDVARDTWAFLKRFRHPHPGTIVASESVAARKDTREAALRCSIREQRAASRDSDCRFRAAQRGLRPGENPDVSRCNDALRSSFARSDARYPFCALAETADARAAVNQRFVDDAFASVGLPGDGSSDAESRCAAYFVRAAARRLSCEARIEFKELHGRDVTGLRERCEARFESAKSRAVRRDKAACPASDALDAHVASAIAR